MKSQTRIIKPTDKIVLLSDFDGTISDINPIPNLTSLRPEAKTALAQLVSKSNFFIGFISGRGMFDLKRKVDIDNVTYSGNHGLEILFPNRTEFYYPLTPEMNRNRTNIKKIIENEVCITKLLPQYLTQLKINRTNISVCEHLWGLD